MPVDGHQQSGRASRRESLSLSSDSICTAELRGLRSLPGSPASQLFYGVGSMSVLGEPGPKRHRPCAGCAASKEENGIIRPTVRKLAHGAERHKSELAVDGSTCLAFCFTEVSCIDTTVTALSVYAPQKYFSSW